MKLIHLSDLHLGKRLYEYSLPEEQRYILDRIVELTAEERPDAVLICGDLFDKPQPPIEAVQLGDDFLCRLAELGQPLLIISGNHDSAERLSFGSRLMQHSGVYIAPAYDGTLHRVTLRDEYGEVDFHLLPFIKPLQVRRCFPEAVIDDYTAALRTVIEQAGIDRSRRNVLLAHQFVSGAERCDSEEISIGGLDNVDVSVFDCFDYVALGHLHGPQQVGRAEVRYCGTPLKYSFSELHQRKSLCVVELDAKGRVELHLRELTPLRELRELRGDYNQLTDRRFYEAAPQAAVRDDLLHIILTDEQDIPDAVGKLRVIYPHLLKLDYDNSRTRAQGQIQALHEYERQSPLELFSALFRQQNGRELTEQQREYLTELISRIWEEGEPCDR